MIKFKKADKVKITSGKDKGREGKIENVFPEANKALIPGINMYKKHVKGSGEQKGGIFDLPRPINFSKFALVCPKCKKNTRVGFKFVDDQKVRICKKCKKEIDTK
jgi:large subunit ribosomal protein L24